MAPGVEYRLFPAEQQPWYRRLAGAAGVLAPAVLLVVIELFRTRGYITIGNLDFFGLVERAKLLPGNLRAWVQGFYPVGVPLLLRAGLALGMDVVRAGQIVSMLGGIACLYGGGLLAVSLTRSRVMGLITMLYLLTTRAVLDYSGYEGTDMLAAGLQVLAIGILAWNPRGGRTAWAAGVVTGLAYLARYTALVLVVVCVAYLVAMAAYRRDRGALYVPLGYGAGFFIGALPQLVPSLLVMGDPFYQTQAYHIWIKLYANSDFVRVNMEPTPVNITLWELFQLGPGRFLANWWREFSAFWTQSDVPLGDHPLGQFAKAGFLFTVLDYRRLQVRYRALLSFVVVGLLGVLSIFTVKTRFLINLAPVLMVCTLYFLWRILPGRPEAEDGHPPVNLLALALVLVPLLVVPWKVARTGGSDPRPDVVEASNMFVAAGAQTAGEVLSTDLGHQDVSSPTRDRYTMLYTIDAPPTVDKLREFMLASGHRFLFYGSSRGLRYHPEYSVLLRAQASVSGYTPVWTSPVWTEEGDRFAAYRVEPDVPVPDVSKPVALDRGISLLGYDLSLTQDRPQGAGSRLGVYLYWRATEPLTQSLKAFVHLTDSQGRMLAQHDSVPALWSRPTQNWEPGETVVDFHWMHLRDDAPSDTYTATAGLYEETTGDRWPVLDASGEPSDDYVTLTQIELD